MKDYKYDNKTVREEVKKLNLIDKERTIPWLLSSVNKGATDEPLYKSCEGRKNLSWLSK